MSDQPPLVRREDAVAIVSINAAPYNRMSLEFMDALEQTVETIAADDDVRALLLTAAGDDNFSVTTSR